MPQINWKKLKANPNTNQAWSGLDCDATGSTVFAVDSFAVDTKALYKSTNGGLSWAEDTPSMFASNDDTLAYVTCTEDGSKYATCGSNSYIYKNISGIWSKVAAKLSYWGLFSDWDGYILFAATLNYGLRFSYDFGDTWTVATPNGFNTDSWKKVVFNKNTSTIGTQRHYLAAEFFSRIFITTNPGSSWNNVTPVTGYNWSVAMNENAAYCYAVTTDKVAAETRLFYSTTLGLTWNELTITGITSSIRDIETDATGQKILLIGYYQSLLSLDGGATWTSLTVGQIGNDSMSLRSLATSSDFSEIFLGANGGSVYKSIDNNLTYSNISPKEALFTFNWSAIACNYNNSKIIASIDDGNVGPYDSVDKYLFYSGDAGATWVKKRPETLPWPKTFQFKSLSMDREGNTIVAVDSPGKVYVSNDSSATWSDHAVSQGVYTKTWTKASNVIDNKFLIGETAGYLYLVDAVNLNSYTEVMPTGSSVVKQWTSVQFAKDGLHIITCCSSGRVYLSSDTGSTWSEVKPNGDQNFNWNTVALNSNGKIVLAGQSAGRLYLSKDYGTIGTWLEVRPAGDINFTWQDCSISDNGDVIIVSGYYVVSGVNTYRQYYSQDYGQSWDPITETTGNAPLIIDTVSCVTSNSNGLILLTADQSNIHQGNVINVKNASFLQGIIF